jgi:serine/threonine protein phosphatase 1
MPGRLIALGDVHGCLAALDAVLQAAAPGGEDTLVALGDYVDRGPDSRGVIERLLELGRRCRLVPLLGNHDEMMLQICRGQGDLMDAWLRFGGQATVDSYGGDVPDGVPASHVEFLRGCRLIHQTERHFFAHANYWAATGLEHQLREVLLWESLRDRVPGPHASGKTAILGHTSQKSGEILDLGYLKCIDTYVYGTGWLTAMDVETGQVWQANRRGWMRGAGG